jgi:hypothetical protein
MPSHPASIKTNGRAVRATEREPQAKPKITQNPKPDQDSKVPRSMHIFAPDQITPNGRLLRCGCSHLQRWLPNWLSNVNTDTPMTSPSEGQVFGAVNEVARTPNSAS